MLAFFSAVVVAVTISPQAAQYSAVASPSGRLLGTTRTAQAYTCLDGQWPSVSAGAVFKRMLCQQIDGALTCETIYRETMDAETYADRLVAWQIDRSDKASFTQVGAAWEITARVKYSYVLMNAAGIACWDTLLTNVFGATTGTTTWLKLRPKNGRLRLHIKHRKSYTTSDLMQCLADNDCSDVLAPE